MDKPKLRKVRTHHVLWAREWQLLPKSKSWASFPSPSPTFLPANSETELPARSQVQALVFGGTCQTHGALNLVPTRLDPPLSLHPLDGQATLFLSPSAAPEEESHQDITLSGATWLLRMAFAKIRSLAQTGRGPHQQ